MPHKFDLAAPKETSPLYRRIQAAMRVRIAAGEWAAGQVLPSRIQLCEEFGTTRVTLDKAIQGLVAEGLLRSARRIGTFVAEGAKEAPAARGWPVSAAVAAGAAPRTLRMGVVVGRNSEPSEGAMALSDNFYFGPLFQGIRDAVSGRAVDTVFAHVHRSEYARFFQDAALDGMLLITPSLEELPTLHRLMQQGILFIAACISSGDSMDAALPCQDTNNRQGARDAVRHLLALGHRRIAVVNLATAVANHHDRVQGWQEELAAAGIEAGPNDRVEMHQYDFERFEWRIEQWLTRALASSTVPTAIFACDYLMTLATLRVLRRHGLRVPEDVSVVGFDDPLSAAHLTPTLTTVRQPVYQLGQRAAQRLLTAMEAGERPHGLEMFATELIVRESTCAPRVASLNRKGIVL